MKRYGERLSGLPIQSAPTAGFTLQESLIVMVIVALLAAIGAPSLMGFFQRRQLATAQDMVYQGLRATQRDAMQTRQEQQFSIRQQDNHLEWASHARSIHPSEVNHWIPLIDGVVFSDIDNTLPAAGDVRYVRFNFQGIRVVRENNCPITVWDVSTPLRCAQHDRGNVIPTNGRNLDGITF
jgi:prepilin-type N-terminal cleavage/methylation domain-containing protein